MNTKRIKVAKLEMLNNIIIALRNVMVKPGLLAKARARSPA